MSMAARNRAEVPCPKGFACESGGLRESEGSVRGRGLRHNKERTQTQLDLKNWAKEATEVEPRREGTSALYSRRRRGGMGVVKKGPVRSGRLL